MPVSKRSGPCFVLNCLKDLRISFERRTRHKFLIMIDNSRTDGNLSNWNCDFFQYHTVSVQKWLKIRKWSWQRWYKAESKTEFQLFTRSNSKILHFFLKHFSACFSRPFLSCHVLTMLLYFLLLLRNEYLWFYRRTFDITLCFHCEMSTLAFTGEHSI